MSNPASWAEAPGAARERWHTEARERDEAYAAELPHDDSESAESPWRDGAAVEDGRAEAAHYQALYESTDEAREDLGLDDEE